MENMENMECINCVDVIMRRNKMNKRCTDTSREPGRQSVQKAASASMQSIQKGSIDIDTVGTKSRIDAVNALQRGEHK